MAKPNDSEKSRLDRLTKLAESLPEAVTEITGRQQEHRRFFAGKKTFGYYLRNHHGDGVIGLCVKVPPGENGRIVASDPKRFYIPAYLGANGWIGVRLDLAKIDWDEIEHLLGDSYLLLMPRRLITRLDAE